MIKRIVKMTFHPEKIDHFLLIFDECSPQIRASDGCRHLELWRCKEPSNVFFTYSLWNDEAALEAYRRSDLFRRTWHRTRQLFNNRPEAWSIEVEREV